jgi:hypothetical protein
MVVGRHDHDDRVGPIYQQDGRAEQPAPLMLKKATTPKNPPTMTNSPASSSRAIGQLPLDEQRAVVELKSRGLLGSAGSTGALPSSSTTNLAFGEWPSVQPIPDIASTG